MDAVDRLSEPIREAVVTSPGTGGLAPDVTSSSNVTGAGRDIVM